MHQSFDDLPVRGDDGILYDSQGRVIFDAVCQECREPRASPDLKMFAGKLRCESCRYFWRRELKPKPTLQPALRRARTFGLEATLTTEQWNETLAYFNHACAYCATGSWRCVEHATPIPYGGTTVTNCLPSCSACNTIKSSRTLEEVVEFTRDQRIKGIADDYRQWERALEYLRAKGRVA